MEVGDGTEEVARLLVAQVCRQSREVLYSPSDAGPVLDGEWRVLPTHQQGLGVHWRAGGQLNNQIFQWEGPPQFGHFPILALGLGGKEGVGWYESNCQQGA